MMQNKSCKFPLISVIIPALNEETAIKATLDAALNGEMVEVIISDGGSSDRTVEICRERGVKVISSPPGRGNQMNAGAEKARGEILLFLHADTLLPSRWQDEVREALMEEKVAGGAFSFSLSGSSSAFKLITFMVKARSNMLGLPYGDQAIFVRRSIFEKMGGFRPFPIMEDVALVRELKKNGSLKIVDAAVITSSRRWEKEGWLMTTVRNQILLYLYLIGISPERLYRFYKAIR